MLTLQQIAAEMARHRQHLSDEPRRLLLRPDAEGQRRFAFFDEESLRGGIARACHLAGVSNSWTVLQETGLKHRNRVTLSEAEGLNVGLLATALGVARAEIEKRRYRSINRLTRNYFGLSVPVTLFETRLRRFSPSFYREHGYHHASWELKFLPFCPVTWEMLQSDCAFCNSDKLKRQLWTRTLTPVSCCDECGRPLHRRETASVPGDKRASLEIIRRLVSPTASTRESVCEILPETLRSCSLQRIFNAIVQICRSSISIQGPIDPENQLGRLHLACEAVIRWPDGLNINGLSFRPNQAAWPRIRRQYAALGAQEPDVPPRSVKITPRPKYEADDLIGLSKAAKKSRVEAKTLKNIWETGLITKRFRTHGVRLVPAFCPHEVVEFGRQWRARVHAATIARRIGVPTYAMEQLAKVGVIQPSLYTLPNTGMFFSTSDANEFCAKITRASSDCISDPVILSDAMRTCSGGLKPWGLVIEAILSGSLKSAIDDRTELPLIERLLVSASEISTKLPMFCATARVDISGLSKSLSQRDALEILNCSGSSLAMLDGLAASGINPKFFVLQDIIDRAHTAIATIDVAEKLRVEPATAHRILRQAKVVEVVPGGWCRQNVEVLLEQRAAHTDVQISLPSSNLKNVEVNAPPAKVSVRRLRGRGQIPRTSASAKSSSTDSHRQLALTI